MPRNLLPGPWFIVLLTDLNIGSIPVVAGKVSSRLILSFVLAWIVGARLDAAELELGIETSPAVSTVNRELTYSLTLTNRSGILLTNVVVNSTFNVAVDLVSLTNRSGTAALEGSALVFRIPQLANTSNAVMSLVIQPLSAGRLTNTFQLLATNINILTNTVTDVFAAEANLGISLRSETNALVTGDWTDYRLTVTNVGPETAASVVVTNFLPAGSQFLSLTPSNPPVTLTGTQLVFSAGTLAPGTNVTFKVRLQVNSTGTNRMTAQVSAPGLSDPSPGNNAVTNNWFVVNPQTNLLSAASVSAQTFNPQTGLMEQVIRLTNPGDAAVAGGRIVFPGIGERVFNAAGTNAVRPFVALTRPLGAGESVDLLIEYFVPERAPFPDPLIEAWAVPAFVPRAPAGDEVALTRVRRLATGGLLLEFAAEPGRAYHVIYGDTVTFTNALRALPVLVAPADRVQWIDEGPPKTSHRPDQVPARFYRIIEAD
jgi:uncharacterized repeat protein (TIGR01451 family)